VDDAEVVFAEGAEGGQLRIHRGFVVSADRIPAIGARGCRLIRRGRPDRGCNFQWHAADERNEADAAAGDFALSVESGAPIPPFVFLKVIAQGGLDRVDVFLAGDFLGERTGQSDDLLRRDLPLFGVVGGESPRMGIQGVEDHERRLRLAAGAAQLGPRRDSAGQGQGADEAKLPHAGRHKRAGRPAGEVSRWPRGRDRVRYGSARCAARPLRPTPPAPHSARDAKDAARGGGHR